MSSTSAPAATSQPGASYRGRFAPSPTGPLHFGSLIAALASFLDARAHAGEWLVRIDDVDRPREVPGSADAILRTLERFALEWDGKVVRQSERTDRYAHALERLVQTGCTYECSCSRTEIQSVMTQHAPLDTLTEELQYPGTCRNGPIHAERALAVRFRSASSPVTFYDAIQGEVQIDVARDCGDFVIRRKDGLYAYQLAVSVDDHEQGVTHVVRGADLLKSTPRQILLQNALNFGSPTYAHVPLAIDGFGRKLSKSSHAPPVDANASDMSNSGTLWLALAFLRQDPPPEFRGSAPQELLEWAIAHWTVEPLRGMQTQGI